jgi:hypothetical protein
VDAFNAALNETRRERRKLSREDAAGLVVQQVLALLQDKASVDSALDDERRRLLHDRAAEPVPSTSATAVAVPTTADQIVADEAVAARRT